MPNLFNDMIHDSDYTPPITYITYTYGQPLEVGKASTTGALPPRDSIKIPLGGLYGTVYGTTDMVDKPPHYTNRSIEVIDMMLRIYGAEAVIMFCELNAFKYRMRAGYKGDDVIEEISKAKWYEMKAKQLKDNE